MYLSDADLHSRWSELKIKCDNPGCVRVCEDNIQPCSIDCCLSNVFWVPIGRGVIDLTDRDLVELDLPRYWKQRVLKPNESIVLKPRRLILGRLALKLAIPADCAGRIAGRSSFARLGIGMHSAGYFINPGYCGHMPLQLYNYGVRPVRVSAHVPICQLMLIKLSSPPSKPYGAELLLSRYSDDDDGSPYRFWNRKMEKLLRRLFRERGLSLEAQDVILRDRVPHGDPSIWYRMARFIGEWPTIGDTEVFLEQFGRSEDRLRRSHNLLDHISTVLFVLLGGSSVTGSLFIKPFGVVHYVLWAATFVSGLLYLLSQNYKGCQYCGTRELRARGD